MNLADSTQPRVATAATRPCQLHRYHWPKPSRTHGHHRKPMYLQKEVWGEVRDHELLWSCGTDHDNVHEWIDWLLGRARRPDPEPGRTEKREAERTVAWYRLALIEKET